jgi:hypothetical protein
VLENATAFILGTRSLNEFDAFVQAIYGMGLQEVLDITQARVSAYYK